LIKHNFFAGPSVLPKVVTEKAARALIDYGEGISIAAYSHRSSQFGAVIEEAKALVREIAQLDDDFEVLFLQGGGRQQFFQIPYNLASMFSTACYVDSGSWAHQAAHEAHFFGKAQIVASSKEDNYNFIPTKFSIPEKAAYLHITSNNTIYGTQYQEYPKVNVPLIVDMSSDIFSQETDYSQFDLIYAATQKNAGIAGVTLVIIKKSLLTKAVGDVPTMVDYQTHINKGSLYNTPPTFAIYMSLLVLRWIKEQGGLSALGEKNEQKAKLLYNEIDRNKAFKGHAKKEHRSLMNAAFTLKKPNTAEEDRFLNMCKNAGIVGIKGHSSVGGFRASMYNALEMESVRALVTVMQAFEQATN